MKFFSETVNQNPDKNNKEKVNEYDQPASEKNIAGFRGEIIEKIEKKAEEINISKEKLIELAGLDLESLGVENLKDLDLNKGGLDFIKDSIDRALNEFWRSEKTGKLVTGTTSKIEGSINEAFEFVKKHKKIVSLGELALYASSFGPAVLKDLAGSDIKVEIYGEEISLKDLVDNPELLKVIDTNHNTNSPLDVAQEFFSKPLAHGEVEISLRKTIINEDGLSLDVWKNPEAKGVEVKEIKEMYNKIKEELGSFGEDHGLVGFVIDTEKLEENKMKIAETISLNTNVPQNEILDYINNSLELNTSKISVVEFEDFEINSNPDIDLSEIKGTNIKSLTNLFVADDNIETSIADRNSFNNLLEQKLQEDGYTIPELKNIANDNPKEVIKILAQTLGKNIEYDYKDLKLIESLKKAESMKEIANIAEEMGKISPYETLKNGKGVCYDYAQAFSKGIDFLYHKNVLDYNNLGVLTTTGDSMNHGYNILFSTDKDGNLVMTSIDITWADDKDASEIPDKLNAVDKEHYYTGIIKKVNEVHKTALEKIKDYNILAFQENLKEILTQYDPKHKSEMKVNKKAFEEITNKKTESSQEDKEKIVNLLP